MRGRYPSGDDRRLSVESLVYRVRRCVTELLRRREKEILPGRVLAEMKWEREKGSLVGVGEREE